MTGPVRCTRCNRRIVPADLAHEDGFGALLCDDCYDAECDAEVPQEPDHYMDDPYCRGGA